MERTSPTYFAAYQSLKLTRDAEGVLVVEFHTNGGPLTSRRRTTRTLSRGTRSAGQSPKSGSVQARLSFSRHGKPRCPGAWKKGIA